MVKEVDTGIFQVSINIDGEWWADEMIPKWFKELKYNYCNAYNSRLVYARALNIFLHHYIYFPQKEKESLHEYLLSYRNKLRNGFTIYSKRTIKTKRSEFTTNYKVFSVDAFELSTINTYMTAIQNYIFFLQEQNIDNVDSVFSDEIDWKYLKKKSINSVGGGYGLMMGPLLAQLLGKKKKLIHNIKINRSASNEDKYFPPELFLELLNISEPREQSIYLLCGCAGTRIGQALTLTRDDYSYDTQEVYIVDPMSDEKGVLGSIPRNKLLKNEYKINMEQTPYKYIACKYPIPLHYSELLWINNDYKLEFFHQLSYMDKGNPMQNGHPFIFNTSRGKVLTPNQVNSSFKRKIHKLYLIIEDEWIKKRNDAEYEEKIKIDNEYEYLMSQLKKIKGIHSLRHMYAIMWADYAATTDDVIIDDLQALCAYGLGHSSFTSVIRYFILRKKTRQRIFDKINQVTENQMNYIQRNLNQLKNRKGYMYGR